MTLPVAASLTTLAVAFIWLAGYVMTCAVSPFGRCVRCHGTTTVHAPLTRIDRPCPRCHGIGRRLRIGRRLYNELRRTYRQGSTR